MIIKTERKTQRHPCAHCNGAGSIDLEHRGWTCENCQGLGYCENLPSGESVCPVCNGEGHKMASRSCDVCKGNGFAVTVYELIDDVYKCFYCGGKGWIKEEILYTERYNNPVRPRQIQCPQCYGSGSVTFIICKTIG